MTDADSIETTDVRGSCAWCDGPLQPHHFVQTARSRCSCSAPTTACAPSSAPTPTRAARAPPQPQALRRRHVAGRRLHHAARCAAMAAQDARAIAERARADGAAAGIVRARVATDGGEPARRARPRRLAASARRADPPHAVARLARVRRRARRRSTDRVPQGPLRRRSRRRDLGRAGARRARRRRRSRAARRQRSSTADTTCGSPIATAPCSRNTSTSRRFRAGCSRARTCKAGDVIGLLGDTGVKESAPHLHFTVSVRPATDLPERYMDPEPLVALWPLRIPMSGLSVALVSTEGAPGAPLGGAPAGAVRSKKKHVRAPEAEPASEPPSESSE